MARLLIIVGLALAAAGVAMLLGVPFGRLPGDFVFRRGAFTFYFPLATSVLVSVVLTLLLMLLRR
jgi:predicted MFS family arabinose efflux permease